MWSDKKTALDKIVDSFINIMLTEPRRITGNAPEDTYMQLCDKVSNVTIDLRSRQDDCRIIVPNKHTSRNKSYQLPNSLVKKIRKASFQMDNNLLDELRREIFEGEDDYSKFKDIQKARRKHPMIETAYQELLTAYGLHADKHTPNVS